MRPPSVYLPRRILLQFGFGAMLASTTGLAKMTHAQDPNDIKDEDVQFALNLEYMEAEYYLRGTSGKGIDDSDVGSDAGEVKKNEFLAAAAGILAVEAYHMGMARSTLYRKGEAAWKAANAVSDARDKIDGLDDKDQGLQTDGRADIVASTPDGIAFTRTPKEVLRIVYLTDQEGSTKGGFYPNGMNGTIKST